MWEKIKKIHLWLNLSPTNNDQLPTMPQALFFWPATTVSSLTTYHILGWANMSEILHFQEPISEQRRSKNDTRLRSIYSHAGNCTVSYVHSYQVQKTCLRINYFLRLWPLPWYVAWVRPNQVHRRHPHTMGDDDCAWFGRNHATARALPRIRSSYFA